MVYFLCWSFICYTTYIFLNFFLLLSVKNDQYINWLSLKERKYKIIVVPYKSCTMFWKHWQTRQFCHNVLYNQKSLFYFAKSKLHLILYFSTAKLFQLPNFILDQREKSLSLGFSHEQRTMLKINRVIHNQISLFSPLF